MLSLYKINESPYVVLFVVSWSIKNLFLIDCANISKICFSYSITNVNPFFLSPYFRSNQSFSFFFSFVHLPANYASILLRSFLNLLISIRILLFQKGSFFFFAFDFFMPTSSPTIFIAACMTFPQSIKSVIFTYSNTLLI